MIQRVASIPAVTNNGDRYIGMAPEVRLKPAIRMPKKSKWCNVFLYRDALVLVRASGPDRDWDDLAEASPLIAMVTGIVIMLASCGAQGLGWSTAAIVIGIVGLVLFLLGGLAMWLGSIFSAAIVALAIIIVGLSSLWKMITGQSSRERRRSNRLPHQDTAPEFLAPEQMLEKFLYAQLLYYVNITDIRHIRRRRTSIITIRMANGTSLTMKHDHRLVQLLETAIGRRLQPAS